jgi:transposase
MTYTRTAHELKNRRRLAVDRVNAGYAQTQVARILKVSPRSVRRWMHAYRAGGDDALQAKPRPGRPGKLTGEQAATVLGWFRQSPTDFGFATELWTARRVAQLIRQRFGVAMNHRYLNAWLTTRGITPQKPQRQAREHDQAAIERWLREDWPRIQKKGRDDHGHIVLIDESGVLLTPLVRRTLAPRGETPILAVPGGPRDKVSVIAGLSLSPVAQRPGLYFRTFPNAYVTTPDTADFLRDLLRHLRGNVIVVWDRGPIHRGDPIRRVLAAYPRLTLESLPAYAPELNPVEQLWNHIKYGRLANLTAPDAHVLDDLVVECLIDAKFDPQRLRGFYSATPLGLPERTGAT